MGSIPATAVSQMRLDMFLNVLKIIDLAIATLLLFAAVSFDEAEASEGIISLLFAGVLLANALSISTV